MGKELILVFAQSSIMATRMVKPNFSKVSDIRAGKHCYNIYCKVTEKKISEITKFNGEVIRICDGVVGDETAVASFRLVGDNVDKIEQNMIISIRNGRSEVVDEHIRLEVDKFGKVQEEKDVTIDRVKFDENISSYAYVKKERKN